MATHNLARSMMVDFRRFSEISALMVHCAFIFEDRKVLNTTIWSLVIVLYDRLIKRKKKMFNGQIIKGDQ